MKRHWLVKKVRKKYTLKLRRRRRNPSRFKKYWHSVGRQNGRRGTHSNIQRCSGWRMTLCRCRGRTISRIFIGPRSTFLSTSSQRMSSTVYKANLSCTTASRPKGGPTAKLILSYHRGRHQFNWRISVRKKWNSRRHRQTTTWTKLNKQSNKHQGAFSLRRSCRVSKK